jgi:hypothetical protein
MLTRHPKSAAGSQSLKPDKQARKAVKLAIEQALRDLVDPLADEPIRQQARTVLESHGIQCGVAEVKIEPSPESTRPPESARCSAEAPPPPVVSKKGDAHA